MDPWDGKERRVTEEERRKICYLHQESIDKMLEDIKGNQKSIHELETVKIPESETFRGQVKVIGLIALSVWIGGFVYTFNHKQASAIEHDRIHDKIGKNTSDISNMKGDQKALIVEVKNLVKEVERSNSLTEKFLAILIEGQPMHPRPGGVE